MYVEIYKKMYIALHRVNVDSLKKDCVLSSVSWEDNVERGAGAQVGSANHNFPATLLPPFRWFYKRNLFGSIGVLSHALCTSNWPSIKFLKSSFCLYINCIDYRNICRCLEVLRDKEESGTNN